MQASSRAGRRSCGQTTATFKSSAFRAQQTRVVAGSAAAKPALSGQGEPAQSSSASFAAPFRPARQTKSSKKRRCEAHGLAAAVLPPISAVMLAGNKIMNKIVLVPMEPFVQFLALALCVFYTLVYGGMLTLLSAKGNITKEMRQQGWASRKLFATIGLFEALFQVSLYAAVANLPGPIVPVLAQAMLLWNFLLSRFVLGKRFQWIQIAGAALVATGASICAGGFEAVGVPINPWFVLVYVMGQLVASAAAILKEKVFTEGERAIGQPLNVFIVNFGGSFAQFICMLVLAPLMVMNSGVPLSNLGDYMGKGFSLLVGYTGLNHPSLIRQWIPLFYIFWNIFFNVVALIGLRVAGAATMTLFMTASVPMAILGFTFRLPLLGQAPPLGLDFWAGAATLCTGMALYNSPQIREIFQKKEDSGPDIADKAQVRPSRA